MRLPLTLKPRRCLNLPARFQDRARIVEGCRMPNDPARYFSRPFLHAVMLVYDSASKMPNDSAQFSHDSVFIGRLRGNRPD